VRDNPRMPAIIAMLSAIIAWLLVQRRRNGRLPARALIISPRRSTVIAGDGGVRSVQCARLTLARADLDRLWSPANLENLGRTYWHFLTKMTLGLIHVHYTENERSVVLLGLVTLLRFEAPEYVLESRRGRITWRIKDGLLVARSGRGSGWLSLDVRRDDQPGGPDGSSDLEVVVEVANFYPSIAAGLSTAAYEATQAFVHVLVTHSFLRSLARLRLVESKVRRFQIEPMTVERGTPGLDPSEGRTAEKAVREG
jgi:hypothetical protein